jgi:hypothetical protein
MDNKPVENFLCMYSSGIHSHHSLNFDIDEEQDSSNDGNTPGYSTRSARMQ